MKMYGKSTLPLYLPSVKHLFLPRTPDHDCLQIRYHSTFNYNIFTISDFYFQNVTWPTHVKHIIISLLPIFHDNEDPV